MITVASVGRLVQHHGQRKRCYLFGDRTIYASVITIIITATRPVDRYTIVFLQGTRSDSMPSSRFYIE